MSKKRKKRRKRCPSFHSLHFEIVNEHFHCKTITHVMLYLQHYINTVHFWLKYNGFATVRKTTQESRAAARKPRDAARVLFC